MAGFCRIGEVQGRGWGGVWGGVGGGGRAQSMAEVAAVRWLNEWHRMVSFQGAV